VGGAPGRGATPPEVHAFADGTRRWLCTELHHPLRGGTLAEPLTGLGLADLLLDVMRESTHADVAVINRGALDTARGFPLSGSVTRLAVVTALRFDNAVRVTSMRGSALREFVRSSRAPWFHLRGITVDGERVQVNGRTIDDAANYRVVTTDFVADRGDGGLGEDLHFQPYGTATTREIMLAWLDRRRAEGVRPAALDLSQRTRWTLRWALDASANWVGIVNTDPTVYTDAQLARSQTISVRVETEARADADHPWYVAENLLRLRYGAARTINHDGTDSGFTETSDLIVARSTFVWRRLRGQRRRWYVPLPYGDLYTESEFTCPCALDPMEPGRRQYHHLEFRPVFGTRFEIGEHFSVFAAAGLDAEVFQPRRPVAPVFVAGWTLSPGRIFSIGSRAVEAESSLDVAWRDPFVDASAVVRLRFRASLPLWDWLAFTVTHDVFARYNAGQASWGFASDLNVGLKVTITRALQGFAW
jgi:hypothetical protein